MLVGLLPLLLPPPCAVAQQECAITHKQQPNGDDHGGPCVPLHNAAAPGMTMSASGLGTGGPGCYNESSDQLASLNSSLSWLQLGGRRFDGAISYACDRGIGLAIKRSGVSRSDVFVTSKVGPGGVPFPLGFNETMAQAKRILSDISSEYVDLLLVHEPFSYWQFPEAARRAPSADPACDLGSPSTYSERGCRLSTWRALVALWRAGAARSIGVSNWNSTHILELEAAGLPRRPPSTKWSSRRYTRATAAGAATAATLLAARRLSAARAPLKTRRRAPRC